MRDCEAHSTVMLSSVDESVFRKLGIRLTCDPVLPGAGRGVAEDKTSGSKEETPVPG